MVKILDCTIRDGGYLTNWSFPAHFVQDLYTTAVQSGVSNFEIGYKGKAATPFATCDENFLQQTITPIDSCKITVMVEADKFDINSFKKDSIISAVRIAAYPSDLQMAFKQAEQLKALGYSVFVNLMASTRLTEAEFEILKNFQSKEILEAIIISDTFGAFEPGTLQACFERIMSFDYKNIGFHAHNNKDFALKNTMKAIELGAYVVDATLFGAGRWAGNANIVDVLSNLKTNSEYYKNLEKKYPEIFPKSFGYTEFTKLSGEYNIHPYYVETMAETNSASEIDAYLKNNADSLSIRYRK